MIRFDRFSFATPPRTASTWFLHAADMAGLPARSPKNRVHVPFPPTEQGFSISIVRHPIDWIVSYYLSLKGGLIEIPAVDRLALIARESQNVRQMVANCAERPGIIGSVFDAYHANTVIKVEDLPWAAIEWFTMVGASTTALRRVKDYPAQNVRRWSPYNIPQDERIALMRSESSFCERYGYF